MILCSGSPQRATIVGSSDSLFAESTQGDGQVDRLTTGYIFGVIHTPTRSKRHRCALHHAATVPSITTSNSLNIIASESSPRPSGGALPMI